jgi:pyroglutamyl-peptidase
VRCIITGFDAFGGAEYNPSQLAVELLPDILPDSTPPIALTKAVLTTCCDEAWTLLQKEFAQVGEDERFLILLSGVAEARDTICLERFALNVRQYRLLDNRGHQWHEEHIDQQGPDAIRTALPLKELVADLHDKGYRVEISNYAGSFVCNETYYRAMRKWQKDKRCAGVLFVHLPSPARYGAAAQIEDDGEVIHTFRKFLEDIIRCVKWE